ncbi:oxidoreductase [Sphingomonas sp. dw_22]|uniref:oxidoreductase n=1 Tax=Sphingomonas sp. dw_22 TaxID=2721175 RepID=UPI001BD5F2C7|nr:oxidoreductase [Sphingomonas sp. dw_22]
MRTWFITGASRGFGALIARQALAAGDAVAATARDPEAVRAALGDHPNLLALPLDVASEAQAHVAAAETVKRFGKIDVLVNNAGFGLLGAVEEATAEEIAAVYRTNVFGLLAVTRAVLPHMRERRSGHILNLSSIGGYRGGAGFGIYSSTKFAVEGLSEALAAELAPLGIKVTIVEPGYFRTDFLDARSLTVSPHRIADYDETAGAVRSRAAEVSHNQPGDPAKLAAALVQLVGEANPPLRMPFGSDTVAAIEAKNAFVAGELAQWRTLAVSTDFA